MFVCALVFFFKQKTAYEMRISDWSSDVCSSDLLGWTHEGARPQVDIALAHPIKLLVNALGPPPKDIVDLAHDQPSRQRQQVEQIGRASSRERVCQYV